MFYQSILILFSLLFVSVIMTDSPGVWDTYTGATFDLRNLIKTTEEQPYAITDGDIKCTTSTEYTWHYIFNICGDVPSDSIPTACANQPSAAALQYNDNNECYVVGDYDPSKDEQIWKLRDPSDPSKGVSVTYKGDYCSQIGNSRTFTIDVLCSNTKNARVIAAYEAVRTSQTYVPKTCSYTIEMISYYGCPKECPITNSGLCSSHGECAYDVEKRIPRCFCNSGYSGNDCSKKTSSSSSSATSIQIGLLVTLLIVSLGLIGVVVLMVKKIYDYRKATKSYFGVSGGESEMSEFSF